MRNIKAVVRLINGAEDQAGRNTVAASVAYNYEDQSVEATIELLACYGANIDMDRTVAEAYDM